MKKFKKDIIKEIYISKFVSILESLNIYIGKGKKKNLINVLKPGFKMIHKKSGLTYTLDSLDLDDPENPKIICHRYDDDSKDPVTITIEKDSFKDYERL